MFGSGASLGGVIKGGTAMGTGTAGVTVSTKGGTAVTAGVELPAGAEGHEAQCLKKSQQLR